MQAQSKRGCGSFSLIVTASRVRVFMLEITEKFLSLIRGKAADLLFDAFHGGSNWILP